MIFSKKAIEKFYIDLDLNVSVLTDSEINEIREILDKANNPLYLFDDDGDGVCAYLILKKHFKKGKGISIKSAGALDTKYSVYIYEEKPDLVVILDKAVVKQELIDEIPCEILYIDHHPIQELKKVKYYNPLIHDKKSYIPTSYMAYKITNDNLWLAIVGCLFDYKSPDFLNEFKKQYPDLLDKTHTDPGYILFKTELGRLIKLFAFNMKGKNSEAKKSIELLENIESPYEIINKTNENAEYLQKRYEKLNREYELLLDKAKNCINNKDKVIVFEYPSSKTSFTQYLATELSYAHQNKTVIVAREKENDFKLSLRNQKKDISKILAKALNGLSGYGGGHKHACGASIDKKDYENLIERIRKLTK